MKKLFEKIVEFIDRNNKIIITSCLSFLGCILLGVFIIVSTDKFTVDTESNQLLNYIEQRNYSLAVSYYNKIKNEFTEVKLDRFSKNLSKKVNKTILNYGDKYIKNEIGKEYFISLINIVNELDTINLDLESILNQVKRVNELYLQEKLSYSAATGYMQAISTLKISKNDIDAYSKKIDVIEESRKIYNIAVKYQSKQMYKEAIENYDKVISDDKKYYDLAQNKKEEAIDNMYDYYIEKAEIENNNGEYQIALEYINYLREYYIDDERLNEIYKEYEKNLEKYNITNEEIIALISRKSGINRNNITANIFQKMINTNKYYYVEAFENGEIIDEFLIEARSKKIYSYLDTNKSYNNNYSDGYWRTLENGSVEFAISKNTAESIVQKKLNENKEKFKYAKVESKNKALKYLNNQDELNKFIGENNDINYYVVVNKGFLKSKEIYIVNVYTKQVYNVSENEINSL